MPRGHFHSKEQRKLSKDWTLITPTDFFQHKLAFRVEDGLFQLKFPYEVSRVDKCRKLGMKWKKSARLWQAPADRLFLQDFVELFPEARHVLQSMITLREIQAVAPGYEYSSYLMMHQRKAARVFPEPVGEKMRVFFPSAILGQLANCGGLGCLNVSSNHCHTYGSNREGKSADSGRLSCMIASMGILGFLKAVPVAEYTCASILYYTYVKMSRLPMKDISVSVW